MINGTVSQGAISALVLKKQGGGNDCRRREREKRKGMTKSAGEGGEQREFEECGVEGGRDGEGAQEKKGKREWEVENTE